MKKPKRILCAVLALLMLLGAAAAVSVRPAYAAKTEAELEEEQRKAAQVAALEQKKKEQQEKLASYFGVSLFYLRGESNDRTRQEDWMSEGYSGADEEPVYRPAPAPKKMKAEAPAQGATMLDALFGGRQAREQFRAMVLEVLRSPEGQEVVAQAVWKELAKRK